jgi:hypothetical protein
VTTHAHETCSNFYDGNCKSSINTRALAVLSTKTTITMSPSFSSASSFCSTTAAANATTRALRALHHKQTAKVAAHARIVCLHAKTLLRLQQEIEHEAATIACADYNEYYDICYDEYCSMESQSTVDNDAIVGQGLVDVVELATSIATYAAPVATEATRPPLPSA